MLRPPGGLKKTPSTSPHVEVQLASHPPSQLGTPKPPFLISKTYKIATPAPSTDARPEKHPTSAQLATPRDLRNLIFPLEKQGFLKNRHSKFTSIFDPILVPTWLHFGTKNRPNFAHKSTPRGIKKTIDFCIDFLSIFDRFWSPTWGHVGHFFGSKGGGPVISRPHFCCDAFLDRFFFEMLAHVGSILFHFGAKLAPFWVHFPAILVPTWRYLRPLGRTSLHWMGRFVGWIISK